jgi:hypothetical protein
VRSDALEVLRLERRSRFFVATVAMLHLVNDHLPHVGARDDSCQTKFSGLERSDSGNNHHFMRRWGPLTVFSMGGRRAMLEITLPPAAW